MTVATLMRRIFGMREVSREWPVGHPVVFEVLPHQMIYGGIKSANNLVNLLQQHGCEAFVCTPDGEPASWLVSPAPCLSWRVAKRCARESDFWIFNWMPDLKRVDPSGEIIIHARDRFQDFRTRRRVSYWAITSSVNDYLHQQGIQEPIRIVTNYVNQSIFAPSRKIPRSVAYMLRRGFEYLQPIVARKGDIVWLPIENEPEVRVAEILGEAELFVYPTMGPTKRAGSTEAFGNPGLEAMACGAVVLAFEYGAPYMDRTNHLTITPETIEATMDQIFSDPDKLVSLRNAGLATAARWNHEQVWSQFPYQLQRAATRLGASHG